MICPHFCACVVPAMIGAQLPFNSRSRLREVVDARTLARKLSTSTTSDDSPHLEMLVVDLVLIVQVKHALAGAVGRRCFDKRRWKAWRAWQGWVKGFIRMEGHGGVSVQVGHRQTCIGRANVRVS